MRTWPPSRSAGSTPARRRSSQEHTEGCEGCGAEMLRPRAGGRRPGRVRGAGRAAARASREPDGDRPRRGRLRSASAHQGEAGALHLRLSGHASGHRARGRRAPGRGRRRVHGRRRRPAARPETVPITERRRQRRGRARHRRRQRDPADERHAPAQAGRRLPGVGRRPSGAVTPSATFLPHPDGTATAAMPEAADEVRQVMVTAEPGPSRTEPTPPPILDVKLD